MQERQSADHSAARQDSEWARSVERGIFFALLLASALGWGLYALLTAKSFYPLLVIRALIVGSCLVVVTAFVLSIPAEGVLYIASARYRLVRGYGREPAKGERALIWKILAAWFAMLLVSVANGAIRDFTYGKHIDELAAHQLSTVSSVLLLAIVIRGFTWLYPPASARQAFSIGLLWMTLTIAFEFLFFHFAGDHSWAELLGNYNVSKGRVWPVVLVWIAIAPYVFFRADRAR
jgi:hypothetical protein